MKPQIKISVRNLVEFILRSGDIDNRYARGAENAMQEGGKMHRKIQKSMGSEYQAEVALSYQYSTENYDIIVEGRADGIIKDITGVIVDEIKCTYRDVQKMKAEDKVHLAQAKCYAYMYACESDISYIGVRLTYCNLDTEEIRYFEHIFAMEELEKWFMDLIASYRKWSDYEYEWEQIRGKSITDVSFPYEYRDGQKDLVTYVYQTIYHSRKLFMEAPTGVGKTLSVIFPSVKAMGNGKADKIFYLTAKTITRTVAEDTFSILRENGLRFKSVTLTAKDKICFLEEADCNPEKCPYAKGHYDRVNDAIYDMLTSEESFSREIIEEYAKKHMVCPFEMCLDASLFADGIICDYNYVFDPHVYLRRFFGENSKQDYLFLIDEAHNLLERGREMYSAVLFKEEFLEFKRKVKSYSTRLERLAEKCNKIMLAMKRECEDYCILESVTALVNALTHLSGGIEQYLEENTDNDVREEILEFYFKISHFLLIYDFVDDNYVMYSQMYQDGSFAVRLFCVNPAENLKQHMEKGRSSILFSATLLPIQYYKRLLGGNGEDYEVYAKSVFDSSRRGLYIGRDVTSKYTMRSNSQYQNIAEYIYRIIQGKAGNYMIFFPSYQFMENVAKYFEQYITHDIKMLKQENNMSEEEREVFLSHFEALQTQNTLVAFCVMGGIFGEGIDLKSDKLIGAVIVGTGLPQVCLEKEILKNYFDVKGENGFDYAYRYPGMNKVLQAAGRVIRTVEDTGIVVLLDERFLQTSYQKMFPREWEHFEVVSKEEVLEKISSFWESRL